MELTRIRIDIRRSNISDDTYMFGTSVYVDSRYLGKQVYEDVKLIGKNDFETLYERMMDYAKHEIKKILIKEHLMKFKTIKGKS